MRALRYVYLLCLVGWLGGTAAAGFIVAPVAFRVLQAWHPVTGRVLAGDVVGAVLAQMSLVAYAAAAVMFGVLTVQRLLGPRPRSYGIRAGILVVMVALTLYSDRVAAPLMDGLQAQAPMPMNQLAAADPRRLEFDRLHTLSTSLTLASLASGLLLLGWETRES